jgi:hypothetical protein
MGLFTDASSYILLLMTLFGSVHLFGSAEAARGLTHATAALGEDPKPIWHRQFSIDFNGAMEMSSWRISITAGLHTT